MRLTAMLRAADRLRLDAAASKGRRADLLELGIVPSVGVRSELDATPLDFAGLFLAHLSGGRPIVGEAARCRIVPTDVLRPQESGIANLTGVPFAWRSTCDLEPCHGILDLFAALASDAMAGRMAEGRGLLHLIEMRLSWPVLSIVVGISPVGREVLADGGPLAAGLRELAITGTYRPAPLRHFSGDLKSQARDAQLHVREQTRVATERSLTLGDLADLVDTALEEEQAR